MNVVWIKHTADLFAALPKSYNDLQLYIYIFKNLRKEIWIWAKGDNTFEKRVVEGGWGMERMKLFKRTFWSFSNTYFFYDHSNKYLN